MLEEHSNNELENKCDQNDPKLRVLVIHIVKWWWW